MPKIYFKKNIGNNFFLNIAYTLAELLIVIGIIGLIADMTIPSLMTNYEKSLTEIQLKKFFSTIANAQKMAEAENGPIENWYKDWQPAAVVFENIKPYLKFAVAPAVPGKIQTGPGSATTIKSVHFRLADGMCGVFRDNGSKSLFGDGAYFWEIYTQCGNRVPVSGRTHFEFSVKNCTSLTKQYTNGIDEKYGWRVDYLNSGCTFPTDYGWKEYECFLRIAQNNWQIKDNYQFAKRTQREGNWNIDVYKRIKGWY